MFGKDRALGLGLVEAARETLGPQRDLLVDTGWFVERTPKQAIQLVRALEPFAPYFIEEILHPEDYDGLRGPIEDRTPTRRGPTPASRAAECATHARASERSP